MNSFGESATHSFFYDGSSFDFLTSSSLSSSDFPITNTSAIVYSNADQPWNQNHTHMPMCSVGPINVGRYISMILFTVVCIIGLFGNSLVIYVVLRFSKMKTVTNLYILNLAFADEFYLIGVPALIYTMHVGEWVFGIHMCKLYMISTSITQFTSSIFLVIMSADRFIAVCHPISSPRFRTPLVSKIVSMIAWCLSVFLMLPIILYSNTIARDDGKKSCNIMWPSSNMGSENSTMEDGGFDANGSTFTLYTFTLGFAIPLCLILIFYYLVLRKLQTVGPKTKSKEKKRSHRKVTKLVLTVVSCYILCWTPYWVSQMALINSSPEVCQSKLEITVFILVGCLGYSNSAMNPILYAFLSDNFKKSFMKAFTCAKTKEINAQLQAENSFFPRFGRGRNSECLSSKPTTNLIVNVNSQVTSTKVMPPTAKFGNTVESILDATENGNHTTTNNGRQLNSINMNSVNNCNGAASCEDSDDDEEQELQGKQQRDDESICIINPSNGTSKPPILHTDL